MESSWMKFPWSPDKPIAHGVRTLGMTQTQEDKVVRIWILLLTLLLSSTSHVLYGRKYKEKLSCRPFRIPIYPEWDRERQDCCVHLRCKGTFFLMPCYDWGLLVSYLMPLVYTSPPPKKETFLTLLIPAIELSKSQCQVQKYFFPN